MSAHESITHPGIIEKLTDDKVFVKVLAMSACASCHAKGMCNIAEVEEKIVEVKRDKSMDYKPGDEVSVSMKRALGSLAVMLGYVVPFLLMFGILLLVLLLTGDEGLAGLLAILILIPYYGLLYLYRSKLKAKFSFTIDPGMTKP